MKLFAAPAKSWNKTKANASNPAKYHDALGSLSSGSFSVINRLAYCKISVSRNCNQRNDGSAGNGAAQCRDVQASMVIVRPVVNCLRILFE